MRSFLTKGILVNANGQKHYSLNFSWHTPMAGPHKWAVYNKIAPDRSLDNPG
jgi:hypothetical protein